MITQEIANYLLNLPKHVIDGENVLDRFTFKADVPINDRIHLISKEDRDVMFFIEITQSNKLRLKLTLHHQEQGSSVGLLRVDFNGRHRNPEEVTEVVPGIFRPFAGQWIEESHIHYFIDGYKPLAWAIPLQIDDTFSMKTFEDGTDEGNAIKTFAQRVNVITVLTAFIQHTAAL